MSSDSKFVFERSSPESQGIATSAILNFIDALERSEQEIHSFMLLRHGHVVAEGWWSPYEPDIPHTMFSLSKAFTSTAIGLAVDEGFLTVDDTVCSFFPDDAPETISEKLAKMRVRHLLTMSTGHDVPTFPLMYGRDDGNWAKGFFETPLVHEPGEHFLYNTGATYMLSEIIQRTTGQNLMDFLTPRLFEPLRIENPTWNISPQGVYLGGVGLNLKTEDIARFGQLYLQKGIWQGQRILSDSWIQEATSAQVSNGDDPQSDWAQGYGYQFWRCQHGLYRGDGAFGQFCIVMEEFDAVLVMTSAAQDMQEVMTIAWDTILPAMQSHSLEEDPESYQQLQEKIATLAYPPLQVQTTSALATKISGKQFFAQQNDPAIESLKLKFSESTTTLQVKTTQGTQEIVASSGEWYYGRTSFFDEIWLEDNQSYVASATWLAENTFQMVVRLYETPYIYTMTFAFDGDKLTLTIQLNVSLISTEAQIIEFRKGLFGK